MATVPVLHGLKVYVNLLGSNGEELPHRIKCSHSQDNFQALEPVAVCSNLYYVLIRNETISFTYAAQPTYPELFIGMSHFRLINASHAVEKFICQGEDILLSKSRVGTLS